MHDYRLSEMLAQATTAAPAPAGPPPSQPAWMTFAPFVLLLIVFYFLLIRPQQKRAKQQAELVRNLKPGDRVVTSSGIVGLIITVKDKTISLRSADAKMEVTKSSVTDLLERSSDDKSAA